MKANYRAELDVSAELSPGDASYYQSLIGVLRWIVELGRVDICLEVSVLSSHLALPREWHMQQVLQVFAYLKKYHNAELVYDPSDPVVDETEFERRDWTASEFGHIDGKEELPPNMPEPRGLGFVIRAKVDADHASDSIETISNGFSRLSEFGIDILVEQEADINRIVILWIGIHCYEAVLRIPTRVTVQAKDAWDTV